MDKRLLKLVNKIKNKDLRRKVYRLLEDPTIEIGGKTYSGIALEKSPASIRHHHNYPGGFVEHTMALYELCMSLSRIVRGVYKCRVDTDLVICGVLLHDIFKPATYTQTDMGRYRPSGLAERVDHLTLASAELIRRGFPLDAVHVVAASHGRTMAAVPGRRREARDLSGRHARWRGRHGPAHERGDVAGRPVHGRRPERLAGLHASQHAGSDVSAS